MHSRFQDKRITNRKYLLKDSNYWTEHTSSSTNNFKSNSSDRIDHSAPDYTQNINKKQGDN